MDSHLNKRNERYFVNSKTNSFNNTLKGLTVIELNITEMCTRTCSFCPRADNNVYKNQRKFMSTETISNLIVTCKKFEYEGDFHICGFGEPTTNKKILELIHQIRKELPNRIALTTNGDLLDVCLATKLLNAGLSYMIVSCYDGLTQKDNFSNILTQAGYTTEQYDIRELWSAPEETQEEFLERNSFSNRGGSVKDSRHLLRHQSPCFLPFYKIIIDWDGRVLLCCNDWLKTNNKLGNINTDTIHDVWYSKALTTIRSHLIKGNRQEVQSCKNCNIYGTAIGELSVELLSSSL